jgi:hypothetical protein
MTAAARLIGAALLIQAATGNDARPLPDPRPFFDAVRSNLARSQDSQKQFAYKERRTDLDLNPFGRLGTGGTRVIEVTPVAGGTAVTRRLLERDGMPIADSMPVRREVRMSEQGRSMVDDVAAMLDVVIDHRDRLDGRDAIVVTFKPRPDAKPRTREGRLARAFAGQIWIDEQAKEVARVDATAIDDLSFGYGVLARLNEGATVTLRQQPFEAGLWLPVSLRFNGEGRALLFFRKLTINFAVDWFDYRKVF